MAAAEMVAETIQEIREAQASQFEYKGETWETG